MQGVGSIKRKKNGCLPLKAALSKHFYSFLSVISSCHYELSEGKYNATLSLY